ncbi:hypothetical protein C9374_013252 [Naegleria lovaniensis]|uniref:Uncharacterized protein n=1 Tax=Naegleria lovaniensis TaxID=51637 RepID=A0AA88H1K7_NAELO|nr:uncharacterized protein C9374_013252 [Naegleria lovaniensis]KAG2391767.1 hypothetical protein C9374_013252 [Naegleria lovaniensis]
MSEQQKQSNKRKAPKRKASPEEEASRKEEEQDAVENINADTEQNVMGESDDLNLDFPEEDFLKEIEEQFELVSEMNASSSTASSKKTKIPITEEKVPEKDEELIISSENSQKYQKVPVSFRVNIVRKVLKIVIILHKIPEKFVRIDVEDGEFTVDTLVNKEKANAQFLKNGIVMVTLPIASIPKQTFEHHIELIKKKQEAKKIKFPQPIKQSILRNAAIMEKKRKRREKQKEKKQFIDNSMDLKKPKKKKKKATKPAETEQTAVSNE